MMNSIISYSRNQMAEIPGGVIDLRDDRIKKDWRVSIEPFLVSKCPVTVELYHAVTHNTPYVFDSVQKPVVNVSWNDAIAFCNLLSREAGLKECYSRSKETEDVGVGDNRGIGSIRGIRNVGGDGEDNGDRGAVICDWEAGGFRLPTEAEWEYACKAGTTGYRYAEIDRIAWYHGNSDDEIHPVGLKEPNAWGLYDMLGNVWEWCWDVYDVEKYGSYRIFRGGGWAEEERGCGATSRRRAHPTFLIDDLGFRVVRSLV